MSRIDPGGKSYGENMKLKGKIALITGASKGIGRAIAIKLAAEGAEVIVNYNGSKESAEEVVKIIQENGGLAETSCFNVADPESVKSAISGLLKKHEHIDILVNNAGITRDGLLLALKESDIDRVLETNLKGAFWTIKALSKNFLKQKSGRIINISSVSGIIGNMGQTAYSASKAGLIGLTKSAARELAGRGICVNAVAPGFVDTDMVKNMTDAAREKITDGIPMKRIGKPEEIAELVAFLSGDGAAYITGQVICVDGGMAM